MKVILTGAAGFVGFHTTLRLLAQGHTVVGIDNLNSYYDPKLKLDRLSQLEGNDNFTFHKVELSNREDVFQIFSDTHADIVIHLGAQAGVRYSIDNPFAYLDSNINGTLSILEGCRQFNVVKLIYASSSSVYGSNKKQPFSVSDRTDSPVSLYAATKKSNELMCHTYSHLYGIQAVGLRFFTVYGPWGRPDMAYFKFTNAIFDGRTIDIYNNGNMLRDFTYIDDIVDGISAITENWPLSSSQADPHKVYNLGNNSPEKLMDMINLLESNIGMTAVKNFLPMQPGDVHETYADVSESSRDFNFSPKTSLAVGLSRFVDWYKSYYR